MVVINGNTVIIPSGRIRIGTIKDIIKSAGVTEQDFLDKI